MLNGLGGRHKARKRVGTYALLVGICTTLFPRTAHAYLDPAAGSLMIQFVAGAILAGALTFKLWWHRLTAFVSRVFRRRESDDGHAE
ncbi:MAG TPA: hypothetical protein HPP77_09655 [Candidatus Hydrogenedentes bacterium]|nr:hypothetical protein [Candidatus Hydrogenedentota bacterium]